MPSDYPSVPETLGDHLRKRRMDLGLWQKEVATILGVDEMTIVNWEKNRRTPTLRSLSNLFDFLGYDPRPEGQTIGEKLRHGREARSISAAELAHEWGVDPATVTKYETRGTVATTTFRSPESSSSSDTTSCRLRERWGSTSDASATRRA